MYKKRNLALPIPDRKVCKDCKLILPLSNFFKRSDTRDGHGPYCKQCHIARNRAWRKAHRKPYERPQKQLRRCTICNNGFKVSPSDIAKYCSLACRNIGYSLYPCRLRRGVTRVCIRCGNLFYVHPSGRRKYCSLSCHRKTLYEKWRLSRKGAGNPNFKWISKRCEQCGRTFRPSGRRRRYCSMQCMGDARTGTRNPAYFAVLGEKNRNWKGGRTPELQVARGHFQHREWSRLVLRRDNYTCQSWWRR